MGRIFVTGDKHGDFQSDFDYKYVKNFCERMETTQDDIMIVLGDHGIHYDGAWHDRNSRKKLAKYPITFVMLRGNHDMRPDPEWRKLFAASTSIIGHFYEDPVAENVLYTKEFGWYNFGGIQTFVICGAYSVDKYYRLAMRDHGELGYRWFANEQLDEHERSEAQKSLLTGFVPNEPIVIMSHTCPLNFKPTDKLLPMVDQSTVDETMEKWMDGLYLKTQSLKMPITQWYCGHWHIDRTLDPVRFMYHDIVELKGTESWKRA